MRVEWVKWQDSRAVEPSWFEIADIHSTKLDALESVSEVVVIGATNRMDLLDRALLNSGRFGVVIEAGMPNPNERLEILQIHTARMPLDPDVDLAQVIPLTEGFTGADLVTLCRRASFERLQAFIAERGPAAEQQAAQFRLRTEDFLWAARAIGPGLGRASA